MNKRKFLFAVMISLLLTSFSGCLVKKQPADEWLISKYDSLLVIQDFLLKLDDTVTLYLTSVIDTETYLIQVKELEQEYDSIYETTSIDDIQPGSFTEKTIAAKEGYEDICISISQLLYSMQNDNEIISGKDALSYVYLAYQEKLKDDFISYAEGYNEAVERRESVGG